MYRKIYGFIKIINSQLNNEQRENEKLRQKLNIPETEVNKLQQWWNNNGLLPRNIASSSDRVNLEMINQAEPQSEIRVKHPISGQEQQINHPKTSLEINESIDLQSLDKNKQFWWLWRFLPELKAKQQPESLLTPAHPVLPDCPLPSMSLECPR